jgi:hypothetical protein
MAFKKEQELFFKKEALRTAQTNYNHLLTVYQKLFLTNLLDSSLLTSLNSTNLDNSNSTIQIIWLE